MKLWKSVAIGTSLLVLLLTGCSSPSESHVYGGTAGEPTPVISSGAYGGPASPNQPPPVYSTPPSAAGAIVNPAAVSPDAMLNDRVNQALRSSSIGIAPNSVSVSSQNGLVTLNGTVPSERQRQMINDLVRNTSGVSSVNDQLQVSAAAPSVYPQPNTGYPQPNSGYAPAPSAQSSSPTTTSTGDIFNLHVQGLNEADRLLAQRILQGLRSDSRLGTLLPTVDINVAQGRVILQGVVQNEQQRSGIETVVRQATGGSNVENQLQVQGGAARLTQ